MARVRAVLIGVLGAAVIWAGCTATTTGYTGDQQLLCSDAEDARCRSSAEVATERPGESPLHWRECRGSVKECFLTEDQLDTEQRCSEVSDASCRSVDSCANGELTQRSCPDTGQRCCVN